MLIGLFGLLALHAAPAPRLPLTAMPAPALRLKRGAKKADIRPAALRCEYLANPLGIEAARPRLYWTLESKRRNEMQSAYQILAAGSPDALKADKGDLWDSGKVVSGESTHIEYAGKPLSSGAQVWWKVRTWDKDGGVSNYSAPATWEMGLLSPSDWHARWIGMADNSAAAQTVDVWQGAQWIWYPEGDPLRAAPEGDRWFWRRVQLPAKTIRRAELTGIADNSFTLNINGKEIGGGSGWQRAASLDITPRLSPGSNLLTIKAHNTDGPAGFACALHIWFADGTEQRVVTDGQWRAQMPAERAALPVSASNSASNRNAEPSGERLRAAWGQSASRPGDVPARRKRPAPRPICGKRSP